MVSVRGFFWGEGVEVITRIPDGLCGGYPIEKPADECCLPEQESSLLQLPSLLRSDISKTFLFVLLS